MRRRNFVAARRAFERASQIDPKSEAVVAALIRVDTAEKNTPEALKRAEALVASSPGSADALYLAAKTQARAGNFALAESTLQKVVSLDPNFADGYTLLAEVYLNQQKLEDARRVYRGHHCPTSNRPPRAHDAGDAAASAAQTRGSEKDVREDPHHRFTVGDCEQQPRLHVRRGGD